MNIKLVVTDLDGTLLNGEKQVTAKSAEAIQALAENGIKFSFCTGRIPEMAKSYARLLKNTAPAIVGNGMGIWDYEKDEAISASVMMGEDVYKVARYCTGVCEDVGVLTKNEVYFTKQSDRVKRFTQYNDIAMKNGDEPLKIGYLEDLSKEELESLKVYKILVYTTDVKKQQKVIDFVATLENACYTSSDEGLLDIMFKGTSKGSGVVKLSQYLGFQPCEVAVLGDFLNDISMFEVAGTSFAMGNAHELAKKSATYVVNSNDEEGFANAVFDYILKK